MADAIDQKYHRMAVESVRAAGTTVQAEIDGYGAVLANRTSRVLAQGGDEPPASTDGVDGGLPPADGAFGSDVADGAEVTANGVGRAVGELVEGVNRAGGAIGGALGDAASEIVDGFADGDPLDGLGDAADALSEGLGDAEDEIEAGVDRAGEQVGDALGEAVGVNPDAGGEADRNGVWGQTSGPTPPPDQIEVTRRSHVVYSDSDGGGHIHESGVPNKTTFPPGWDEDRIIREVRDVARNPDAGAVPVFDEDRGAWRVEGVRDGVLIRSYVTEDGDTTGHPISGPGVHRNDENGDPQPLP